MSNLSKTDIMDMNDELNGLTKVYLEKLPAQISIMRKALNSVDTSIHRIQNRFWLDRMNAGAISKSDIEKIIINQVGEDGLPKVKQLIFSDSEYKIVKKEEFLAYIEYVWKPYILAAKGYVEQERDCDNFALIFLGKMADIGNFAISLLFGYCTWVDGYHAFNYIKFDDGEMVFEPQTGKLYELSEFKSANVEII